MQIKLGGVTRIVTLEDYECIYKSQGYVVVKVEQPEEKPVKIAKKKK